jgi:hypothetical protein
MFLWTFRPGFGVNNRSRCLSKHCIHTVYNQSKHCIVLKVNISPADVSISITVPQARPMPQITLHSNHTAPSNTQQAAFGVRWEFGTTVLRPMGKFMMNYKHHRYLCYQNIIRASLFCYITMLCTNCTVLQGVLKSAASVHDSSWHWLWYSRWGTDRYTLWPCWAECKCVLCMRVYTIFSTL